MTDKDLGWGLLTIFLKNSFNGPWVPSHKPVIHVPDIADCREFGTWKLGKGVEIEQVDGADDGVSNGLG